VRKRRRNTLIIGNRSSECVIKWFAGGYGRFVASPIRSTTRFQKRTYRRGAIGSRYDLERVTLYSIIVDRDRALCVCRHAVGSTFFVRTNDTVRSIYATDGFPFVVQVSATNLTNYTALRFIRTTHPTFGYSFVVIRFRRVNFMIIHLAFSPPKKTVYRSFKPNAKIISTTKSPIAIGSPAIRRRSRIFRNVLRTCVYVRVRRKYSGVATLRRYARVIKIDLLSVSLSFIRDFQTVFGSRSRWFLLLFIFTDPEVPAVQSCISGVPFKYVVSNPAIVYLRPVIPCNTAANDSYR